MAANDNAGLTVGIAVAPLAIDGVSVSAQAQAAFAHAAAPALSGSTTATWTFSANNGSIGATAGFASAVTLTATGELDGGPTVTLDLVPFEGLNQIISSGAPAILLQEIGKLLAEAWAKLNNTRDLTAGSDELIKFIQAVIDAGAALGITGDNYFYQVVEAFVADPLSWLKTTFTGAAGAAAIARLVDLLVQEFNIKGVAVVDNQLRYQAPLPDNVPGNLTLQFGPSGVVARPFGRGRTAARALADRIRRRRDGFDQRRRHHDEFRLHARDRSRRRHRQSSHIQPGDRVGGRAARCDAGHALGLSDGHESSDGGRITAEALVSRPAMPPTGSCRSSPAWWFP